MYKSRYLICLYDEDDLCIGVFDTVRDFAKTYNLTIRKAKKKVNYAWSKHGMSLIDDKVYRIYFVENRE